MRSTFDGAAQSKSLRAAAFSIPPLLGHFALSRF